MVFIICFENNSFMAQLHVNLGMAVELPASSLKGFM